MNLKNGSHSLPLMRCRAGRMVLQEMKSAADWIAGKFREYGLKSIGENDNFFQEYTASSRQGMISERNVIGIIEGSDPVLRNQYIVVSAHFDHIGIRKGNPAGFNL